jgi:hypothetical protein
MHLQFQAPLLFLEALGDPACEQKPIDGALVLHDHAMRGTARAARSVGEYALAIAVHCL